MICVKCKRQSEHRHDSGLCCMCYANQEITEWHDKAEVDAVVNSYVTEAKTKGTRGYGPYTQPRDKGIYPFYP